MRELLSQHNSLEQMKKGKTAVVPGWHKKSVTSTTTCGATDLSFSKMFCYSCGWMWCVSNNLFLLRLPPRRDQVDANRASAEKRTKKEEKLKKAQQKKEEQEKRKKENELKKNFQVRKQQLSFNKMHHKHRSITWNLDVSDTGLFFKMTSSVDMLIFQAHEWL